MRISAVRGLAIGLLVLAGACRLTDHSGDGLCSLLGPCGNYNAGQPITIDAVVDFPDSLVSTDPNNQIGIVPVGRSISLRHVRATSSGTSGPTVYQTACAVPAVLPDSLRWAVSDSAVASISGGAGRATLRTRAAGTVSVLTTTIRSGTVSPSLWLPYVVACPSGRLLNLIRIVPS